MSAKRYGGPKLKGPRWEVERGCARYPAALKTVASPPNRLYVVGDAEALEEGLAVVGARKATPYGRGCARRFSAAAAERGLVIISGGARGCDAEAHKAALAAGGRTVAFLGGGCDELYPAEHHALFQEIVDGGGAVVSEHPWDFPPVPYAFRARNRLIAGLAKATLIVEAGLPSGTFSTADEALSAGREVLVVPGAITSASSRGANRLLYQGAVPIVDDESFQDALFSIFCLLRQQNARDGGAVRPAAAPSAENGVAAILQAEPLDLESLYEIAYRLHPEGDGRAWLMECLAEAEAAGSIARYPDGRWGPAVGKH